MVVRPPANSNNRLFDNPTLYRSIMGELHYLTVTRPEIHYAVNCVSQSMHAPTEQNFQSLKQILRYLKGSSRCGLLFQKWDLELSIYLDSDWANYKDDRCSTTGYLLFLVPNLISWCTKKQTHGSHSSPEANTGYGGWSCRSYVALSHYDALGLPHFRPRIYCENESTICCTKNPVLHDRMKHVGSDNHFVREQVMAGTMSTHHVPSSEQLADILTKPLPPVVSHYPATKLPLVPVYQPAGR